MQLTSTGLLTGTPAEVAKRTRYTFIIRATAGTQITDRNFYLDVEGADAPVFTTAAGQLNKPLSTVYTTDDTTATADNDVATADITGNVTVLDGSKIGIGASGFNLWQLPYIKISVQLSPITNIFKT